jgi:alcohol dehydrogenase class IV
MIEAFEWAGPGQVVFGVGTAGRLATVCRDWGRRVLVVTGQGRRVGRVLDGLEEAGVQVVVFGVAGEPTMALVEEGARLGRQAGCEWLLAVGGGSVVDAGKAMAALMANEGPVMDYVEVIGMGRLLERDPVPFAAVPTTAGTGAEATRNAVLSCPEQGVKVSLRHRLMLPRLALIDPELAVTVPPEVTATTGMDALTQLLEAFVCTRSNPMVDALCGEGIGRAVRSLRRVVADGTDLEARSDMALAALFSGMALANAGLGAVHGFAAPIGGRFGLAHGAVCAALLPAVWAVNVRAVRARGTAEQLERFRRVAVGLTGDAGARAEDGVEWLGALAGDLRIRSLGELGVGQGDWADLILQARRASSMKANPVVLTEDELVECLSEAGGEKSGG